MMHYGKILSVLLLTLTLGVTACSPASENTSTLGTDASGTVVTSGDAGSLEDQARILGDRARSVAEDALGMGQDFLSGFNGQEVNGDSFRRAWERLKIKLQEMAASASTDEARSRIEGVIQDLEVSFNENVEKIRNNASVQEIQASIAEFWNEARTRISALLK